MPDAARWTRATGPLLWMLLSAGAGAQATVHGVVRDSLTGRPLIGATVQLIPGAARWEAGFTATSDSSGQFAIADVPSGRYVFGFQHPTLDSLGLDAVSRTLDIGTKASSVRADIALPSARSMAMSLCGARRDSTGALFGRVFDAATTGIANVAGVVRVRWAELQIENGRLHRAMEEITAPIQHDGRYVICGVPLEGAALLSAAALDSAHGAASGEIEVTLTSAVPAQHRDLLVAVNESLPAPPPTPAVAAVAKPDGAVATPSPGWRGSARLAGRVVTSEGRALTNARITVRGSDRETVSDDQGAFQLSDLPAGTRQVSIVAIGFAPSLVPVNLRPETTTTVTATIRTRVPTLESVRIFSAAPDDRVGFYKRRAAGVGYFVDRDMIRKSGAPNVVNPIGDALALAPMLRQRGASGRGACRPVIYVDGMRNEIGPLSEVLNPLDIGAIEVYANPADAPPQYNSPGTAPIDGRSGPTAIAGNSGCSVIIIWTTAMVPSLNSTRATEPPPTNDAPR